MANFTFSVSKKPSNLIRVKLTKHEKVEGNKEYYTFINSDGESEKFEGLVSKIMTEPNVYTYIGKIINKQNIELIYHPSVESTSHVDEYFSYFDQNGNERIFIGEPTFDLEKNTYVGDVIEENLHDEIITIFTEK